MFKHKAKYNNKHKQQNINLISKTRPRHNLPRHIQKKETKPNKNKATRTKIKKNGKK